MLRGKRAQAFRDSALAMPRRPMGQAWSSTTRRPATLGEGTATLLSEFGKITS